MGHPLPVAVDVAEGRRAPSGADRAHARAGRARAPLRRAVRARAVRRRLRGDERRPARHRGQRLPELHGDRRGGRAAGRSCREVRGAINRGLRALPPPPSRRSPMMPEVVALLEEWGAHVDVIYPEEELTDLATVRDEHDLYILKSGTELALSLAGALHAIGAATLNPYPIAARCRDKIVATRTLERAGVPVPATYTTLHPSQLAPLLNDGPLVLKPHRGSEGRGVHVVWDADELDSVSGDQGPVFAQRYHEPDGRDRKIYVIGDQVFGVKRVWPVRSFEEKLGEPFTITPELRDIALRCGAAFGLELYGLDVIFSHRRPYVVDISSFPGFKGVPDATLRLPDYIYAAPRRGLAGGPPVGRAV